MAVPTVDSLIAGLRLRQLALVAAIVERGSVKAAASAVHVTQPAATKMLHEIESQLGSGLFVRGPRGMSPTPLGEAVALFARQVVADLGRLRDEVGGLASGAMGSIRVGCTTAAIPVVLTPAISRLQVQRPRVTVTVTVDSSDVLLPQLLEGRLDVLLGRVYTPDFERFDFEPLASNSLGIVMGPSQRRRLGAKPLVALADRSWILPPAGNVLRSAVESAFRSAGLSPPRVGVETNSTIVTLSLLASTGMVSVLPIVLARDYERKGLLTCVATAPELDLGPFGLVWRKGRLLTPLALAFCDEVRACVGKA
jgi:DNA-binding transcriptional LysR family regulator